uniref:Uncharacterized protein n=1 Tax=Candidatus Kentrum sp. SD TaxID=2126332 RepID=A0A451BKR8_9GAMM|nr:MAG: hypothetical protein BECKSD772D_GA0070982_10297 [Candidatus Kentron sp. SD]
MPRARIRENGKAMQLDLLAYANDEINLVMVVAVKSRMKMEAIE